MEASRLDSLLFFKPGFMSLARPHPIWSTAGSSPAKVAMATVQAQMISGRFRMEQLCSNWSKNKLGVCLLSQSCSMIVEDLEHILSTCIALQPTRDKLMSFTNNYCSEWPIIRNLILNHCSPASPNFCQFLLDCSSLPDVILEAQQHGSQVLDHIFHGHGSIPSIKHR